jgi:hypothetical protein
LQIPDLEMRNRPAANGTAIHISDALTTPLTIGTDRETLQARRISRLFFLSPATASTVAMLAYGGAA